MIQRRHPSAYQHPGPRFPFASCLSGRDSTTCCPNCLSRATPAGRGKASPCPPIRTRARRSHAPPQSNRKGEPGNGKLARRKAATLPTPPHPQPSMRPLAACQHPGSRSPFSLPFHMCSAPICTFALQPSPIPQLCPLPYSILDSVLYAYLDPVLDPPRAHFPSRFLNTTYESANATNCA